MQRRDQQGLFPKLSRHFRKSQGHNSDENLQRWRQDPQHFLSSVITCDETWLSTFEMETKRQSSVWLEPGQDRPTKARSNGWAKKTMMTLFFDEMGVVWVEFMPPKMTITSEAFIGTLRRFKEAVRKKRPKLWAPSNGNKHSFLLHMDNASAHTAAPTETKMAEWGIRIVSHPPYSPDLAPCDYAIFPKLKEVLRGIKFDTVKQLQERAKLELSRMPKPIFAQAISDLTIRWQRCLIMQGDYFEGKHVPVDVEEVMVGEQSSSDDDSD